MNSQDRLALLPVITALRKVRKPANPMDLKGLVARLDEAVSTARTAALVIENCGYGEYELAKDEAKGLPDG